MHKEKPKINFLIVNRRRRTKSEKDTYTINDYLHSIIKLPSNSDNLVYHNTFLKYIVILTKNINTNVVSTVKADQAN